MKKIITSVVALLVMGSVSFAQEKKAEKKAPAKTEAKSEKKMDSKGDKKAAAPKKEEAKKK